MHKITFICGSDRFTASAELLKQGSKTTSVNVRTSSNNSGLPNRKFLSTITGKDQHKDICSLDSSGTYEVNASTFTIVKAFATKAGAIV